jgi:NADH-quinone oxidoreductase subunit C
MANEVLTNALVIEKLQAKFGDVVFNPSESYDVPTIFTNRENLIEVVRFLYDTPELKFQFLTDICAVHFPEKEKQFQVVYHLHSLTTNVRLRIKVDLHKKDVHIPSLTPIFLGANWVERETYDYYGILFDGHPDLRRILNMDDMIVFPMRREYTLEDASRTDKDDTFFGR